MSSSTIRKIYSIEGLRGALALWVLFYHTLATTGLGETWRGPFRVIADGRYAVDTFIVISGFVIFYLLSKSRETYWKFIWRRFLRLYPVYLLCLIFYTFLVHLEITTYGNVPWFHHLNADRLLIAENSLKFFPEQLIAHLCMIHSVIPDWMLPSSNYAILGPAWSLSLEWQFYVLAPLIFAGIATGGLWTVTVVALACAAHFLLSGQDGFLPRHVPMFALGIASFYVWRLPWRPPSLPMLGPVVVALAYLLTHSPGIVVWCTVFIAAYAPDSFGSRLVIKVLECPVALFLGRISYSVYLSHSAVLVISMATLERFNMSIIGQWPFFLILLSLVLGGTIGVSTILYRFIESPCIVLGQRHGSKRTTSLLTAKAKELPAVSIQTR